MSLVLYPNKSILAVAVDWHVHVISIDNKTMTSTATLTTTGAVEDLLLSDYGAMLTNGNKDNNSENNCGPRKVFVLLLFDNKAAANNDNKRCSSSAVVLD